MITLEQIRLLESKITRALELIRVLKDENTTLRKGLESAQRRMRELETLVEGFKTDQKEIESVIVRTLHNLDELEESAATTATPGGIPAATPGGIPAATPGGIPAATPGGIPAVTPGSIPAASAARGEGGIQPGGGRASAAARVENAASPGGLQAATDSPSPKEELDIF